MAEIPQLQDSEPVMSSVHINSKAQGYEEFAKTLGALAGAAEQKTEEIASDQSQTMYINSVANAEQIKTDAQKRMLENPDQAPKIASQTAESLDLVNQSAFVNKKDRARLNSYISGTRNDVDLKATATEVKQRQLEAAFTHYANWPDQLKAYQTALMTDHVKAEQLHDAMMNSLHSLVGIGAISPEQAGSSMKTMGEVVGLADDHYKMYGNAETTAKDFHTVTSNPLSGGVENPPVNTTTGWMVDYYNNDKSFQGVLADIANRKLPNPQVFDSLPKADRQHAVLAFQGTQIADGIINSGEPYNVIKAHYDSLSRKDSVLSYRDEATKKALGNYLDRLNSGDYLSVMSDTPMGNSIMKDFVAKNSAIANSPIDDGKKNELAIQNKTNLVNQAVAYGDAHHIPRDKIQPIPKADVAVAQSSFQLGQDPSSLMTVLDHYGKQNSAYVANAMKDPNQRIAAQAVALAPSEIPYEDKLNFISANQTGRSYSGKGIVDDEGKDNKLKTKIYSNLGEPLRMLNQIYTPDQAQILQNSMLETTLKYAKFLAAKDNNIEMKDGSFNVGESAVDRYINQACKMYQSSFKQNSGTNWVVNNNQLPTPMSDKQLDILSSWVIGEGNNYLHGKLGDERYSQIVGRTNLKMIITPTFDVQAVNANGDVAFSVPYNSNLLEHASREVKRRAKEEQEQTRSMMPGYIERMERQRLNVRLPDASTQ